MHCQNYKWGYWKNSFSRGKKIAKWNPHPYNKRGKLIIEREKTAHGWHKFTDEEIEQGTTYTGHKLIPIKCGCCELCRLNRANQWVTRAICEQKTGNQQGFKLDLTYNKQCIPEDYCLKKSDVQTLIKRIRQQLKRDGETRKFKTIIAGEYGPKRGRPHYHIIFIGWMPDDLEYDKDSETGYPMYKSEFINSKWYKIINNKEINAGFATCQPITAETISYVTRYTNKKSGKAKSNKGISEYINFSKNIGRKYWELNKEIIKEDLGIWIKKGDKANLQEIPRYYKKLWQQENPVEYELFIDYQELQQQKAEEQRKKSTDKTKLDYMKTQTETSLIVLNMLKRSSLEEQSEITIEIANNNDYNTNAPMAI